MSTLHATSLSDSVLVILALRKDIRPHGPSPASSTLGKMDQARSLKQSSSSLDGGATHCSRYRLIVFIDLANRQQHVHMTEIFNVLKDRCFSTYFFRANHL